MMKVLLPIDFSDFSEAAISEVKRRPWPESTKLSILHVVETITTGWIDLSTYIADQTASARKLVGEAAKQLSATGLQASDLVLCGYPPVLIPQYAEAWGADLVIVGSHGAGGLARFLLGSVAKSVLQATQCSVEIFRLRERRENGAQMKILLATDGSEYSEQAARAIAERPWPTGTIVKVLGVVELPPAGVDPWNAAAWVIDSLREERTKNAGDSVNQAESIVASAGLKTLTEVVAGHAKVTIIDNAKEWNADLIALGSHGRRGFKRLLLGSVAETVALHAHCSVEVIRRTDGSQQENPSAA